MARHGTSHQRYDEYLRLRRLSTAPQAASSSHLWRPSVDRSVPTGSRQSLPRTSSSSRENMNLGDRLHTTVQAEHIPSQRQPFSFNFRAPLIVIPPVPLPPTPSPPAPLPPAPSPRTLLPPKPSPCTSIHPLSSSFSSKTKSTTPQLGKRDRQGDDDTSNQTYQDTPSDRDVSRPLKKFKPDPVLTSPSTKTTAVVSAQPLPLRMFSGFRADERARMTMQSTQEPTKTGPVSTSPNTETTALVSSQPLPLPMFSGFQADERARMVIESAQEQSRAFLNIRLLKPVLAHASAPSPSPLANCATSVIPITWAETSEIPPTLTASEPSDMSLASSTSNASDMSLETTSSHTSVGLPPFYGTVSAESESSDSWGPPKDRCSGSPPSLNQESRAPRSHLFQECNVQTAHDERRSLHLASSDPSGRKNSQDWPPRGQGSSPRSQSFRHPKQRSNFNSGKHRSSSSKENRPSASPYSRIAVPQPAAQSSRRVYDRPSYTGRPAFSSSENRSSSRYLR